MSFVVFFFFFKQKTAYEMRISDWSSDVCSSDLFQSHPGNGNGNGSQRFGTVLPDNQILAAILALREEHPGSEVILVSKDINLRIKAAIVGVVAEDYENDRALDDFSLLYTGATALPEDFWDRHERSEEHTSELQSLMRISYAVFCLKKQR